MSLVRVVLGVMMIFGCISGCEISDSQGDRQFVDVDEDSVAKEEDCGCPE